MSTPIITDRDPGDKDPPRKRCDVPCPGTGKLLCALEKDHAGPHLTAKRLTIYEWWNGTEKP